MSNNSSGGVGFVSLLQVLFIGLKLGNVIAWSWFWVLAPIWITLAIVLLIIVIALIIAVATK